MINDRCWFVVEMMAIRGDWGDLSWLGVNVSTMIGVDSLHGWSVMVIIYDQFAYPCARGCPDGTILDMTNAVLGFVDQAGAVMVDGYVIGRVGEQGHLFQHLTMLGYVNARGGVFDSRGCRCGFIAGANPQSFSAAGAAYRVLIWPNR